MLSNISGHTYIHTYVHTCMYVCPNVMPSIELVKSRHCGGEPDCGGDGGHIRTHMIQSSVQPTWTIVHDQSVCPPR